MSFNLENGMITVREGKGDKFRKVTLLGNKTIGLMKKYVNDEEL